MGTVLVLMYFAIIFYLYPLPMYDMQQQHAIILILLLHFVVS